MPLGSVFMNNKNSRLNFKILFEILRKFPWEPGLIIGIQILMKVLIQVLQKFPWGPGLGVEVNSNGYPH